MEARNQLIQIAALNNAAWCDTVCRSHYVPGEFLETVWVNRYQPPIYYPNLVTLLPIAELPFQQEAIADLLTVKRSSAIAIKDSFALLDLAPFGFHTLFQARWILRQPDILPPAYETIAIRWEQIRSGKDLINWEDAWSGTSLSTHRLFLPSLLEDATIHILAAYQGQRIIAGAIANWTKDAVGLSNVFTPADEVEHYWNGFLTMINTLYPALPVVGYEQDESLAIVQRLGFTTLGPLQVWMKSGNSA